MSNMVDVTKLNTYELTKHAEDLIQTPINPQCDLDNEVHYTKMVCRELMKRTKSTSGEVTKSLQRKVSTLERLKEDNKWKKMVVTDHAIVRFMERVCYIDVDAIREALAKEAAASYVKKGMIFLKEWEGYRMVVDNNTVTTIYPYDTQVKETFYKGMSKEEICGRVDAEVKSLKSLQNEDSLELTKRRSLLNVYRRRVRGTWLAICAKVARLLPIH